MSLHTYLKVCVEFESGFYGGAKVILEVNSGFENVIACNDDAKMTRYPPYPVTVHFLFLKDERSPTPVGERL